VLGHINEDHIIPELQLLERLHRLMVEAEAMHGRAPFRRPALAWPASFPPAPIKFQASRLHTALPARLDRPTNRPVPAARKFGGYCVIARKGGVQVRLWARTTSEYSTAFTRIRDAVAALPVNSAVLDGEAILLRPDNTSNFDGLRSRQGQAEAILVAYDIMEADGQDMRPEPLEARRKRLARLLSRHRPKATRGDHRRRSRHLSPRLRFGPRRHSGKYQEHVWNELG
jgi:ATP-dependent DNA ligase